MKRDIFQAIADPTRRAIILMLAAQTMTPTAIAHHFEISRQATSKHIQVLNDSGLVEQIKNGREIHYQLRFEKMDELDIWLDQLRQSWQGRYENLDNLLAKMNGGIND